MDPRSDGSLLAAWRDGDAGAFEALVHRHDGALLRHARALLGDWRGGEDVVQEALLRLARTPPELPAAVRGDPEAEHAVLASWLHRVTRNLCMDTMRSEERRRRREEHVASAEATSGGLAEIEAEDTRNAVERGLSRLPADQREVLVLRLLGERSYREIAEITGKKAGTVGWLISVGLKALAQELAPLVGRTADSGARSDRMQVEHLQGEPS
ncbi:MAG: RNA polymerase sigma factor [Planctomycetota bacterium]